MQNVLERIVKYNIYVLVVLLPLFFLPFSFEVFEFSKQYLLFFLVSLAFLAWLAKQVIFDKEIRFRCSPLDYFVLGFLAVAILSAVFSVDKISSIYGFYGRFSNGLMGLLCLVAFYFLITNNVGIDKGKIGDIRGILKVFLWSAALVVLTGYFSVFGLWTKVSSLIPLPRVMLQGTFNPVSGSLEGLAVFLSVIVVLLAGLLLTRNEEQKTGSKKTLFFLYCLLFSALGLMIIVDFTAAWLILLVTLILLVGFSMWKRLFRENVNRLLIPILLIIAAAALIPLQPVKMGLAQEQVLSQSTSWEVAFQSATDNVKSGFLGSGIGTFYYDFAKHKPVDINKTWLWQIRFDRTNYWAEILGTMGFLGILAYLGLIGMFLLVSWILLGVVKGELKENKGNRLPLLMVFLALLVSQFVYYQNTTLAFAFWLMLGLAVVSWQKSISEKVISFKNFPELSLVFSALVIVSAVTIAVVYFYAVRFYLADVRYNQALSQLGQQRMNNLEGAIRLNPRAPQYRTALARIYLYEALNTQDTERIQLMVAGAIDQARIATTLQPNQVAHWETLSIIYREIRGMAAGAIDWGVKSFERAINLEPTNPVLYTELGKLYLLAGDTEKARTSFNQALEKKSDYSDALIQKALLLEKEELLDESIKELEGLVRANPFNIEALFQLGRLYFNNNQVVEAIELFGRVVILVPNHSNAHYSLGVAYVAQGQKSLAIQEFEKVLELNPGNQDIIQKLQDLKGE